MFVCPSCLSVTLVVCNGSSCFFENDCTLGITHIALQGSLGFPNSKGSLLPRNIAVKTLTAFLAFWLTQIRPMQVVDDTERPISSIDCRRGR